MANYLCKNLSSSDVVDFYVVRAPEESLQVEDFLMRNKITFDKVEPFYGPIPDDAVQREYEVTVENENGTEGVPSTRGKGCTIIGSTSSGKTLLLASMGYAIKNDQLENKIVGNLNKGKGRLNRLQILDEDLGAVHNLTKLVNDWDDVITGKLNGLDGTGESSIYNFSIEAVFERVEQPKRGLFGLRRGESVRKQMKETVNFSSIDTPGRFFAQLYHHLANPDEDSGGEAEALVNAIVDSDSLIMVLDYYAETAASDMRKNFEVLLRHVKNKGGDLKRVLFVLSKGDRVAELALEEASGPATISPRTWLDHNNPFHTVSYVAGNTTTCFNNVFNKFENVEVGACWASSYGFLKSTGEANFSDNGSANAHNDNGLLVSGDSDGEAEASRNYEPYHVLESFVWAAFGVQTTYLDDSRVKAPHFISELKEVREVCQPDYFLNP